MRKRGRGRSHPYSTVSSQQEEQQGMMGLLSAGSSSSSSSGESTKLLLSSPPSLLRVQHSRRRRRLQQSPTAARRRRRRSPPPVFVQQPTQLLLLCCIIFLGQHVCQGGSKSEYDFYDNIRYQSPSSVQAKVFDTGSHVIQVVLPKDYDSSDSDEEIEEGQRGAGITATKTYRLAHIAAFLPITDGVYGNGLPSSGLDPLWAATIAIHHFNTRDPVAVPALRDNPLLRTCNVRLTMDTRDTELSPIVATTHLVNYDGRHHQNDEGGGDGTVRDGNSNGGGEHGLANPHPVGIFGASRSATSGPLSILSGVKDIPVISAHSTSSALNNKGIYRYFSRTVPSDDGIAKATASYFREVFDVRFCGVLYINDEYGSSYHSDFVRAAVELDPPMQVEGYAYLNTRASIEAAMDRLVQSGFNYFLGVVGFAESKEVLEVASERGLVGRGKFWLLSDGASAMFSPGYSLHLMNDASVIDAFEGLGYLSLDVPQNHALDESFRKMGGDKDFITHFMKKLPPRGIRRYKPPEMDEPQWLYLSYDAIMSMGIAACASKQYYFLGSSVLSQLRNLTFTGASGDVRFDRLTGSRSFSATSYKVLNLKANLPSFRRQTVTFTVNKIATQVPSENGALQWKSLGNVTFGGGDSTAPLDLPPSTIEIREVQPEVVAFGLATCGVLILIPLGFICWTIWFRQRTAVRMSQPIFLVMLCCGTMVIASCIVPISMAGLGQWGTCMAYHWLFSMGFVISFSALFSKISRMRKIIHRSRKLVRSIVTVRDVLLPFAALLAATTAVLTAWTVVAPLHRELIELRSVDQYGRPIESYESCRSEEQLAANIFFGLLYAIDLGALLIAMYHLWRGWDCAKLDQDAYYIRASVFGTLQILIVGFPAIMMTKDENPEMKYVVRVIVISILCFTLMIPLIVPGLRLLRESTDAKRRSLIRALRKEQKLERFLNSSIAAMKHELETIKAMQVTPAARKDSGGRRHIHWALHGLRMKTGGVPRTLVRHQRPPMYRASSSHSLDRARRLDREIGMDSAPPDFRMDQELPQSSCGAMAPLSETPRTSDTTSSSRTLEMKQGPDMASGASECLVTVVEVASDASPCESEREAIAKNVGLYTRISSPVQVIPAHETERGAIGHEAVSEGRDPRTAKPGRLAISGLDITTATDSEHVFVAQNRQHDAPSSSGEGDAESNPTLDANTCYTRETTLRTTTSLPVEADLPKPNMARVFTA